jgi:alkylhydroperoxidase/carboxymuconolactone decarboxylase family protein YurZ
MASVKMIAEADAKGRVAEIYAEIRSTLGTDFVPNLYKVMAVNPAFLESNWAKVQTVMTPQGKLDRLTKEIIAVAVSSVIGCEY